MSSEQKDDCKFPKDLDISCVDTMNGSFQNDALERSLDLPTFEFSSPISSIGSNCSSPDRERIVQPEVSQVWKALEEKESGDYVSLEDLRSQISPPSDTEYSVLNSYNKVELETIFEDCYLETPPGTPGTQRPKKARRFRMNLNNFEEFKENVQNNNNKQPESAEKTDFTLDN